MIRRKHRSVMVMSATLSVMLWVLAFGKVSTLKADQVTYGINYTVYDNRYWNASPPLPPSGPIIGSGTTYGIDHYWGTGPIFNTDQSEDVVVNFVGFMNDPNRGLYYICGQSDDGFRLGINGTMVINDWYDRGGGCNQVAIVDFSDGESKSINAWYYENGGGAFVSLKYWSNNYWETIPASWYTTSPVTTTTTTSTTTTSTTTTSTTVAETTTTLSSPPTTHQETTTTTDAVRAPATTLPAPEPGTTSTTEPETQTTPLPRIPVVDTAPPEAEVPETTAPPETLPTFPPAPDTTYQQQEEELPESSENQNQEQQSSDTTIPGVDQNPTPEDSIEDINSEDPEIVLEAVSEAIEVGINGEMASTLAADPDVLAVVDEEQAGEIFSAIDEESLTAESAAMIVEAVQGAPDAVREVFEDVVDLFSGVFDDYTMLGSTVTVGQRRTVVAVAALTTAVAMTPVGSSPQPSANRSPNPNDAARKEEDEEEASGEIAGDGLQWIKNISIYKYVNGVKYLNWKAFIKKFGYGVMNLGFTLAGSLVVYLTLSGPIQVIAGISTLVAFTASMWLHMKEPDSD